MANLTENCVLCGKPCSKKNDFSRDISYYRCHTCGDFGAVQEAEEDVLVRLSPAKLGRLSACTRERTLRNGLPVLVLFSEQPSPKAPPGSVTIDELLNTVFPTRIQDRVDRALLNLCVMSEKPGQELELDTQRDYPLIMCEDEESADFLLSEIGSLGLVNVELVGGKSLVTVRADGLARAEELEDTTGRQESEQVFVAMWFDENLNTAYQAGIEKAVTDCGFRPVRIDAKETNDKICDEIIAEIRRSRFVIADFTGNRGGVYFEAGYALGLGIPVVWTCREDCMGDVHFDTNHYSHVVWADPDDLYRRLVKRIGATIEGATLPPELPD